MPDRPSALELVEAVRRFLETEVAKGASDPRLRFRALVAANALSIAGRELTQGEAVASAEAEILRDLLAEPRSGAPGAEEARALSAELCRRIREGRAPRGTLAALRRIVERKLSVASPRYLGRAT
jgi:hypothetical protein